MSNSNVFTPGKTYTYRYIGDSDLTGEATITRRTAKSVWFTQDGGVTEKRCKVYGGDTEYICPFGMYSMCVVLRASNEKVTETEPTTEGKVVVHLLEQKVEIPEEGTFTFEQLGFYSFDFEFTRENIKTIIEGAAVTEKPLEVVFAD